MLFIQTEINELNWLRYILDEFCRIEKAEFKIEIVSQAPKGKPCITYSSKNDPAILERANSDLSNGTTYLSNEIYVLSDSYDPSMTSEFNYDLFWNAFYFLSRKDEYEIEKSGIRLQSYSKKSSRKDRSTWNIPVVNSYFLVLRKYIELNFPELIFDEEDKPILELAHDLDYIEKTNSLRIKQSAFHFINGIKGLDVKKLGKGMSFLLSKRTYWHFDHWCELEKSLNLSSIFYVYSKIGSNSLKKWLLDPGYDVLANKKLSSKLSELVANGWQIGLHGSFNSATNEELLRSEKDNLERALGHPVTKTRQHWLRYEEEITPFIHEKLFEQDSTIGWNDRIGFRAGIASKYRPYSHKDDRPFDHFIVPQVIMDSHIYDYGYKKEDEILIESKKILELCRNIPNAHFSISWHPRTWDKEYNWHKGYEKLIRSW